MTEKQLDEKIGRLGGNVEYPACVINLPQKLNIKTKAQALDLIDVLIGAWGIRRNGDPKGCDTSYMIYDEDRAYKAIKKYIQKGTA